MADWGPFGLNGKNAIVTGGARGIGRAIAERFLEAGANVLIADVDGDWAARTASELTAEGAGTVVSMRLDVREDDAGEQLAARAVAELGSIDILVNNAGVYPIAPMLEMPQETFDLIYQVNSRGLAYCTQAVGRRMVEQGSGGVMINLASVDGFRPTFVGLAAYNMSKGGVVMFTKALALELAPHRIRVNAIAPGGISTEGTSQLRDSLTEADKERMAAGPTRTILLGGRSGPDEIAKAAVFLASDGASYVTGETLVVDGGFLLG